MTDQPDAAEKREQVDTSPASACSDLMFEASISGGPPETVSRFVWWIARLAMTHTPYRKPNIGDTVVETTHLCGTARKRVGRHCAIGELLNVENVEGEGEVFTIRTIEGNEQRWLNAMFCVVEEGQNNKDQVL